MTIICCAMVCESTLVVQSLNERCYNGILRSAVPDKSCLKCALDTWGGCCGKRLFYWNAPVMLHFIEMFKNASTEKAMIWFNTGTDAEKSELLRRLAAGVSSDGQKIIENAYPYIKTYLSEVPLMAMRILRFLFSF